MAKHTTAPESALSATTLSISTLLLIAQEAAETEPGGSYEAKNHRARNFVARLIGHLDEEKGDQLALALGFTHLMTPTSEAHQEVPA